MGHTLWHDDIIQQLCNRSAEIGLLETGCIQGRQLLVTQSQKAAEPSLAVFQQVYNGNVCLCVSNYRAFRVSVRCEPYCVHLLRALQ